MNLDKRYFDVLHTKTHENTKYYIVQPKGNPMVLFSDVDGSPLASVHLKCQGTSTYAKSLITKRNSGETDFQGLVSLDHQEFELVLTNLTGKGMIKIDIMKNDRKVDEVDPGPQKGALNEVNELHHYQSIAVHCDQKDNRSLILNAIKSQEDGEGFVSVKTAEDSGGKVQGTKYYLSVVAEAGKAELVKKFEKTFWACVDVFVIEELNQPEENPQYIRRYSRADPRMESSARSYGGAPRGFELGGRGGNRGGHADRDRERDRLLKDDSSHRKRKATNEKLGKMNPSLLKRDEKADDDVCMDSIVDKSYATTVASGRYVEVQSSFTGKGYNYDLHSVKCSLGLSVAEGLKIREPPSKAELIETGESIAGMFIDNKGRVYLDQLTNIYTTEECVICLSGTPDGVFYSCGHKCCHHSCGEPLKSCPMCRQHITANVKIPNQ
eukprot:TRINITY_DN14840_c0_g1_i1.p1 TRINITY_DN14840_c0_g1~~TRINITY_DN14840_c0_g1_i1.p1  ORF type:complete len:453 (-),score=55.91 TRINITY_DN14840_c0_g1_i1:22-1335(-)